MKALEKYPEVHRHSLRVFFLCYGVLSHLPEDYLSPQEQRDVMVGALLHDIGKSLWPREWLTLPIRELPPSAWEAMKMHPVNGSDLLQNLCFRFPDVLDIIAEHHEKSSGDGYPSGTYPGKATQVLSACDMLAAATEPRAYRKEKTPEQALEELQLDATILKALKAFIERRVLD